MNRLSVAAGVPPAVEEGVPPSGFPAGFKACQQTNLPGGYL